MSKPNISFTKEDAAILRDLFNELAKEYDITFQNSLALTFEKKWYNFRDETEIHPICFCFNESYYYIYKQMSFINGLVANVDEIKIIKDKFISKEFYYKSLSRLITIINKKKQSVDKIVELNDKWTVFNSAKGKRTEKRKKIIKDLEEEIVKEIDNCDLISFQINELAYHYELMEFYKY